MTQRNLIGAAAFAVAVAISGSAFAGTCGKSEATPAVAVKADGCPGAKAACETTTVAAKADGVCGDKSACETTTVAAKADGGCGDKSAWSPIAAAKDKAACTDGGCETTVVAKPADCDAGKLAGGWSPFFANLIAAAKTGKTSAVSAGTCTAGEAGLALGVQSIRTEPSHKGIFSKLADWSKSGGGKTEPVNAK
jgi:hypothetical protein